MKQIHIFLLLSMLGCTPDYDVVFKVSNHEEGTIEDNLFGHFLERPSWDGEYGPEAALIQETHELQPGILEIMQEMQIPVIRFPGGTDVDYTDWMNLVDNIPDRVGNRPLVVGCKGETTTPFFGYDEAGRLAESLGANLLLVVNFGDAYFRRKPVEEAAFHEAALIAYCAIDTNNKLPESLKPYPKLRARNGHPQPYPVTHVQIANEPWLYNKKELVRLGPIPDSIKEHYFTCLKTYIDLFRKIAPEIKIIADGNSAAITEPLRERFGDDIDMVAYHIYKPWGINKVMKGSDTISRNSLSEKDVWQAWTAVPDIDSNGYSVLQNSEFLAAKASGYPVAITEWNWNGWWGGNSTDKDMLGDNFTKGIGAAGFIHAMMRESTSIKTGFQSMLIGNSWGITGIRVSREKLHVPYVLPTACVTAFYSKYHGSKLLSTLATSNPGYRQPYRMSGIYPGDTVSYLDAITTREGNKVFFHVINRNFENPMTIQVDVSELTKGGFQAIHHLFTHQELDEQNLTISNAFTHKALKGKNGKLVLILPEKSVSIVELILVP